MRSALRRALGTVILTGVTATAALTVASAASADVAAAAPGAVPVVTAGLPVTPAGPAFGTQFHGVWSDYTDARRAAVLDALAGAGTSWVRIDLGWSMLQPTGPDSVDAWGVGMADKVIDMAVARGLTPLVTLWLTPAWANGGAGEKTAPTNPADYARIAQWAAARWAGKVGAWEVWNEANSNDYFTGADPVTYTRLLQAAYPAFHAGDPATKVVFSGTVYNDDEWIGQAYAAGAQGSFDVMSTHPYMGQADAAPETADDGNIWTLRHAAAVRALMVAKGDADKPLWFTEFGWSTHANAPGAAPWSTGVTEQQQADYLVRALRLIKTEMPYVTNVFWYTDHDRTSEGTQAGNYGLLTESLTAKPALVAVRVYLAAAAAPVAASTIAPVVPAGPTVQPVRTSPASSVPAPLAGPVTAKAPVATQIGATGKAKSTPKAKAVPKAKAAPNAKAGKAGKARTARR